MGKGPGKLGALLILATLTFAGILLFLDLRMVLPTLLLIVQVALLAVPLSVRIIRKRFDAFEIGMIYAFVYTLYAIPLIVDRLYLSGSTDVQTTTLYLLVTTLGLASFWLGYNWKVTRGLARRTPQLGPPIPVHFLLAAAGYGLVGIVLLYLFFRTFGGLAGYIAIGYGAEMQLATAGKGVTAAGLQLLVIGCGLLWYYGLISRSLKWALLAILIAGPLVALRLEVGDRGTILGLMIVLLSGYGCLYKKITVRKAAFILVAGYAAALTFGVARYALSGGLRGVADWTRENFDVAWLSPTRMGEFTGVATSLYDLIETRSQVEYRYGSTYLILFDIFLPVSISPERAEPLCQWYVRVYHPDVWRVGGGLAFFTAAEAFLNFWFFGAFIQFFVYGALLGMVYEYFRAQRHNAAVVFVYAMLLRWIFPIVRIDFASAIKSALIFGVIPGAFAAFFIVGGRFVARAGQSRSARTSLPLVPGTAAPGQK